MRGLTTTEELNMGNIEILIAVAVLMAFVGLILFISWRKENKSFDMPEEKPVAKTATEPASDSVVVPMKKTGTHN